MLYTISMRPVPPGTISQVVIGARYRDAVERMAAWAKRGGDHTGTVRAQVELAIQHRYEAMRQVVGTDWPLLMEPLAGAEAEIPSELQPRKGRTLRSR